MRDRVQAMQLYDQARALIMEQEAKGDAPAHVLLRYAHTLQQTETWRLQLLTDFSELPDFDEGHHWGYRGQEASRAPADATGNPVFFRLPESYADAANDGERWRALLAEVANMHPPLKNTVLRQRADFAYQLFGVHTLQEFSWFFRQMPSEEDTLSAAYALHTLEADETIARLANGVKRFRLPADWQFVTLYRELADPKGDAGDIHALDRLVTIHENRRQYPVAADYLGTLIKRHGDDRHNTRKQRLDQIVGNQAQFEMVPVFPAGTPVVLEYRFRNGSEARFEAKRVDAPALLADLRAYLMDNPREIDHNRVSLHNLGHRILHQNEKKYLRDTVAVWTEALDPLPGHFDQIVSIRTPLQDPGAYLVTAEMKDGSSAAQLVWIESTVIVEKPVEGKTMYFVADAITGEPIPDATIEFFGYRVEYLRHDRTPQARRHNIDTLRLAEKTDKDGLVYFTPPEQDNRQRYQWLVSATTPDPTAAPDEVRFSRFAFLDFRGWWSRSIPGIARPREMRVFGITDRPVYRPGNPVHFKAWVRRVNYDKPEDASEFAGQSYVVKIRDPRSEIVLDKTFKSDAFAGFDGTWELPADAALGVYAIDIEGRGRVGTFRVEEYKSPEFEVKVDAPTEAQMLGDVIEAVVRADYLFGAPVTEATVKVKVMRSTTSTDFYPIGRWDWLYGRGYLWLACDAPWHPGWNRWGVGRPWPIWWPQQQDPPELVAETEQPIGKDGTVRIAIDTSLAKAMHGNKDHRYSITAEVVDASRRTIVGSGSVLVARDPFRVFVQLERGHLRPGEASPVKVHVRRPDGQAQTGEGTAKLYRLTFPGGELQEELIESWAVAANAEGVAELKVRPMRSGQYRLSAEITAGGVMREGATIFAVAGPGVAQEEFRFEELELVLDQAEYAPGEKVRLRINTRQENGTVLLFVRPLQGVYPVPQVVRLKGYTTEVEVPVAIADMPNFFVEAVSVQGAKVYEEVRQIAVPPASRALNVELTPSAARLPPGGEVHVQVRVTDDAGKPVQGSVVLTVYDRAIEYISGGSNVPAVLQHFWSWKRHHNPNSRHSVSRWSPNVVPPDMVAWRALGIFGHLADRAKDAPASPEAVVLGGVRGSREPRMMSRSVASDKSDMMLAAPSAVAMEASADVMVGEDAAGADSAAQPAEATVRSEFADTAFWAGALVTDKDGLAEVSFTMPDNLTSWRVKSWAMAHGTKVGEQSADIITTKNLLLRLQAPRFFVEKDEVTLSAIVHNYFAEAKPVQADLEIDGDTLKILDEVVRNIKVPAGGSVRVDWRVRAIAEGEAVIRMRALSDEESDAMQLAYPVYVHGMLKTESFSGVVRPDAQEQSIALRVPEERRPEQSRLEVRYSPTLAGAMVDALPYLVAFPYGCTEQTLNRFLPTVITQRILLDMGIALEDIREKRTNLNAQEIGDDRERAKQWQRWNIDPVFDEKKVAEMVREGLQRLSSMQNGDGGWGWFSGYGERSYPHTTMIVVRGLLVARQNGAAIIPGIIENGLAWLRRYEEEQLRRLALKSGDRDYKRYADNMDAGVHLTLQMGGMHTQTMTDRLYKDRNELSIYAKSMLGLVLHAVEMAEERDMVIRNIEQVLVQDDENQTAWLNLGNGSYWWHWYGSEYEAHAYYLKLLAATDPQGAKAAGVVKYLLNNRKHATYWNSTRDTALCVEAMADFLRASGEDKPDMTVEILLNDAIVKTETITAENLFSFDNQLLLEGKAVKTGEHTLTVRRQGRGPVYFNAYLTNFTLEDPITAAGLEVKVQRKVYRLVRDDRDAHVAGSHGQAVAQRQERYRRIPLASGAEVQSGDLIEVELELESKNDYEYIVVSDFKAAGFESVEQRSGYLPNDMGAYVELRDNRVVFFVRQLARGRHSVAYRLRAEIPGRFSALPATIAAMYAPELVGNSDEIKLGITD
ncbi:MAG: alpha-2-macroglobulin family protein [Kiritimatiellia bacterium]